MFNQFVFFVAMFSQFAHADDNKNIVWCVNVSVTDKMDYSPQVLSKAREQVTALPKSINCEVGEEVNTHTTLLKNPKTQKFAHKAKGETHRTLLCEVNGVRVSTYLACYPGVVSESNLTVYYPSSGSKGWTISLACG